MKFRFHAGGYNESMATAFECSSTVKALKQSIRRRNPFPFVSNDFKNIVVKPYGTGIDSRNGWDTHIVLIDGYPIGFTDGPINHKLTTK